MTPAEPGYTRHMAGHDVPIPDYDNLPTGSLESRVRTLDADGVSRLLEHEREHADRVQVVQMLEHRLDRLRSGEASPSGGDPDAMAPETAPGATSPSPVSPETQGPVQNPPSHGVPTNPAQPRT